MIQTEGAPNLTSPLGPASRVIVGIGELGVGTGPGRRIVTYALGSCVAVCIFDPINRVGGLLHFLLPEARINPTRARLQPCAFADTGIPLLFDALQAQGFDKRKCLVKIVGGADVAGDASSTMLDVGKRNALAARALLWRHGVLIRGEAVGGSTARTVSLSLDTGHVHITNGRETIQVL